MSKVFVTYPNAVKQSLRNLQRDGAFIAAFTSEKKVYSSLAIDSGFFLQLIFQSLYDEKENAQPEQCAIMCLIAKYCTRWRCNFKGLLQDGGHGAQAGRTGCLRPYFQM
jgi:hypothetical protein